MAEQTGSRQRFVIDYIQNTDTINEKFLEQYNLIIQLDYPPYGWTNEKYAARNIYIFMGHDPGLFQNESYKKLFSNAIFWAAGKAQ